MAAPGPLPRWLDPMTATSSASAPSGDGWVYERKLDGVRALAYVAVGPGKETAVRLLSRNRIRQDDTYPEIAEALAARAVTDMVVDGEVVAFVDGQTSFERLQRRMGVHDASRARRIGVDVRYVAFDLLWLGGHDIRGLDLASRKQLLAQALDFDDPLRFSEHRAGDGAETLVAACAAGWEGLMAKRLGSTYRASRSRDWLKLKCQTAQEMVVGGFTEPSGSRTGLGALLVGVYCDGGLHYAGKVGTGFSRAVLASLRTTLEGLEQAVSPFADTVGEKGARWARPELVVQVGFSEWTRDDRLRHPRYLGLREDRSPTEVVREPRRARR